MAAPLEVTCPNCRQEFKVPAEVAGKRIRCKNCQTAFQVPGGPGAGPARPVAARPASPARPVAKPASPPPPADPNAPIGFKPEEEEETQKGKAANPYGVVKESEVARCPFCAQELDPPDTKICMNCGYNLLERKRHGVQKVYAPTGGEYFMHWLPGLLAVFTIFCCAGNNAWFWVAAPTLLSFLQKDEKNPITGEPEWYIKWWCCPLWFSVFSAFFAWRLGKYAIRRLIVNWKPQEKRIESQD